jgi:hypothetical protein
VIHKALKAGKKMSPEMNHASTISGHLLISLVAGTLQLSGASL